VSSKIWSGWPLFVCLFVCFFVCLFVCIFVANIMPFALRRREEIPILIYPHYQGELSSILVDYVNRAMPFTRTAKVVVHEVHISGWSVHIRDSLDQVVDRLFVVRIVGLITRDYSRSTLLSIARISAYEWRDYLHYGYLFALCLKKTSEQARRAFHSLKIVLDCRLAYLPRFRWWI
jgi:hypothetical protein